MVECGTQLNQGFKMEVYLLSIVGVIVYFLPSIIAYTRPSNNNLSGVFIVNLLLGWTFIGWVVALVMAVQKSKK